ncbi:coiled-coil domain-containing protein 170 [Rana temporaria]|uniref:coiled-coil domain-containing protein 170 n=1 Tax=Rana temporaria TaxID=8407 RepID=UPI001AADA14E|nr:coiled-coil domain-containing protein 170 [Rana temporaria]
MSNSSLSNNGDSPSPSSVPGAMAAYGSRHLHNNRNTAFRSVSPTISLTREETEAQEHFKRNRIYVDLMDDTVGTKSGKRNKKREDVKKHTYDPFFVDNPITRDQMNHYRIIAENSHSELAAMSVKYETAQSELLDLRTKVSSKEMALQELKAEVENYRENNARQSAMITSLRARVHETEEETGLLATSKSRAELTIQAVFHENRELKDRIQEMESRLKNFVTQWEDSKSQASRYSRNYGHFLAQLSACLNVDIKGQKDPEEVVISKAGDILKENIELKGNVVTQKETINVHETESKASRETIMKLVSEINKEKKKNGSFVQQIDTLCKNLESVSDTKQALEKEIVMLQDRLKASQRAWEACKQELNQVKKSSTELDVSLKSSIGEAKAAQNLLDLFMDEVAAALSDASITVKPKEEAILERIHDLQRMVESKKIVATQFESRASKLNDQLQHQSDLHQEAFLRAKKAEHHLAELRSHLKVTEGELVSGDVMRDNLSYEKQKYMKFLEQLSEKMKLDRITADVGFDMRLDVILARADQLVKLESDAVVENKTLAHGLQRKLKAQKEKFESKELHMELLRKKIAQLEEEKQVRTALAVERDEANLTVRTLQKKVERLQKELGSAQQSVTELKSRLADTNELKIKTLEQYKTIEKLNKSVEQLEKVKGKTEKRLLSIKSELDFTEREAKEEKDKTGNYVEVITSELKTLKKTLEDISKREKQLIDFREVVSHLLGLNVNDLALPDYEIIKRLEGLVHSHHHHVSCA